MLPRFFMSPQTAIILDPSVAGTNHTGNTTESTWSVTFPNYTISGIASCNNIDGTWATAYSGNQNNITMGYQENQPNCWCRMLNPVRSLWIFATSGSGCSYSCAELCGRYSEDAHQAFRTAMYRTAGQ